MRKKEESKIETKGEQRYKKAKTETDRKKKKRWTERKKEGIKKKEKRKKQRTTDERKEKVKFVALSTWMFLLRHIFGKISTFSRDQMTPAERQCD